VRIYWISICLVMSIGLVLISGFVAAAVPLGGSGVNTRVSLIPDPDGTAATPVQNTNPMILFNVSPSTSDEEPALLCTGKVAVAVHLLICATVHLLLDDDGIFDSINGEDGTFIQMIDAGSGGHSVGANVSFDDRHPGPALSRRMMAEIPYEPPFLPLAKGRMGIIIGGMDFFFWRRGRGKEKQPEEEGPHSSEVAPVAMTEDLRETAGKFAAGELREGIDTVYREFLVRLNRQQPGARLRVRTPREIQEQFEGTPIATPLAAMITIYEAVVYSGRTPVEKDRKDMIDLFVAIFSELERDDR